MSDLIVPNIICFQTQLLTTLNNIRALIKNYLIDLHACNFMHAKTSLHAHCMHAPHHACKLLSPENITYTCARQVFPYTGLEIIICHRTLTDGEPILSDGSFLSLDTRSKSEL